MVTSQPNLDGILMGDEYDYSILGDDVDPDDLKEEYVKLLAEIQQHLSESPLSQDTIARHHRLLLLPKVIFGSNLIEQAGGPLDLTHALCQLTFCHGLWDELPSTITAVDPIYHTLQNHLLAQSRPSDPASIISTYRETHQHIKAFCHLMDAFRNHNPPAITESLFLTTHGILTSGIDIDQNNPWPSYSGRYRTAQVVAGLHAFPPAEQVPSAMHNLITSLNRELDQRKLDPVALAAKYSHMLVNIHPFLDGNGRMCRILLNALLYNLGGGALACFGQDETERDEYLGIAARASQNTAAQQDEWEEGEEGAPKYYKELASYTLKHVTEGLGEWKHWLEANGKSLELGSGAGVVEQEGMTFVDVINAKFRGPDKVIEGSEDILAELFAASGGVRES
ncbi:fido domain-containing protein [Cercophora samala]|uniref:Fido domain-containing protein n=1 Tax=Cercophora samala TaxID=330535 RepID=A0AA40DDH1_9PEZI|nr:fido domain-containing protein [Cercophora samala]